MVAVMLITTALTTHSSSATKRHSHQTSQWMITGTHRGTIGSVRTSSTTVPQGSTTRARIFASDSLSICAVTVGNRMDPTTRVKLSMVLRQRTPVSIATTVTFREAMAAHFAWLTTNGSVWTTQVMTFGVLTRAGPSAVMVSLRPILLMTQVT